MKNRLALLQIVPIIWVWALTSLSCSLSTLSSMLATPTPFVHLSSAEWTRIIASENNLAHPFESDNVYGLTGPGVSSNGKNVLDGAYGYAMVDEIFYENIIGDSQDQAFVWLDAGTVWGECGTFHTGLLIYRFNYSKPVLAATIGGLKLNATIDGRQLIIRERFTTGFGNEGKCTTSGFRETRYRWQSNQLVPITSYELCDGETVCANYVRSYYSFLQTGNYAKAYATLSPSYQNANPYDRWLANQQSKVITDFQVGDPIDGWTKAVITTTATVDSSQVIKHYEEKWKLIWQPDPIEKPGIWVLDQVQANQLP